MAMELVAGPLMGAVLNVLLERIASTEVVNFFKNKNCEKLLKRLKIILLSVNVVLNDAEEKQMKNGAVKEWLEELKDVAFAAEDLLDEIYTDAKMKAKQVNTLHTGPVSFYCKGVEEKIEDVHERLEFIMRQKEVLDLKVGKEVKMSQKTPTSSFVSGTFSIRMECSNTNEIKERTRHLSHIIADSSSYVNLKDVSKANCLRTFLQIRPVGTHIYSLPNSVGELKHLRYLEVADTEIVRLPKSICSLFNLQTLKLVGCHNLIELPASIHKLVNLRHLDIRGTSLRWMPLQINELNNLQNLSDFFVGKGCGSSIGELGELSCLHGELFIHCLEHIVSEKDCEKAKLKEKQGLEKLSLEWCGNGETDNSQKEKTILNSLQPHTNLKNLDIYDYPGTEFPEWLGDHSFYNLVSVLLNGSKYCYKLPPLGQLPMLKELQISKFEGLVSVGSEFLGNRTSYVTDCFPALEILRIEYMPSWEKWYPNAENAGTKAFFHLREFHIGNCPKLRGDLPDKLPSLTLLVIRDCKRLLCSLPNSPSLRVLNVQNCESLEFQVHSPCCHQSLTSLFLHGSCDSLVFLPLDLFPNIKSLDIWGCKNLEALTVSESDSSPPTFKSLHSLRIRHCPNFTSFPKGGFAASKLTLLTINYCQKLNSLPEQMHDLMPSLKEVQLRGCPKIESSSVRPLRIRICSKHMEGKQNLSDPLFARLKGVATDQSPSSS
ncbi:leucine-rich repeat-containing protein [Vigna unguiculata]|uniref:Leucine-rich repeat-containing protein n=1 Tax=Vigna unguiculata TaxID=3917 RepID=A0A4D6MVY0_VIGUN|nr:leucine-rich repeat-containing protein [Vigna unguiculata]